MLKMCSLWVHLLLNKKIKNMLFYVLMLFLRIYVIWRFGYIGLPQFSGTILKLVLLQNKFTCEGKIGQSRPIPDCTNFCARTNNLFWENLIGNNPRPIFDHSSCSHNFTIFWSRNWSQSRPIPAFFRIDPKIDPEIGVDQFSQTVIYCNW